MRTYALLIWLIIASCKQQEAKPALTTEKLQADIAMKEKVNAIAQQLRTDCDSNLLALAKYKADSIKTARKHLRKRRR